MRKTILFFLALVLMCSCEPIKTLPKDEFAIGKRDTLRVVDTKYRNFPHEIWYVEHLKIYKHDYLEVKIHPDLLYLIEDPNCSECARIRDSIINSVTQTVVSAIDSATVTNKTNTEMLKKNISTAIRKLNNIQNSLIDYE